MSILFVDYQGGKISIGLKQKNFVQAKTSEQSERVLCSKEKLKLGGMVEGMCENVLGKEFLGSVNIDRVQVGGPQVPLLGRGRDPKLGMRGLVDKRWPMMRLDNVYKVARVRSVDHRCLF